LLLGDLQLFPDVVLAEGDATLLLKRDLAQPIRLSGLEYFLEVLGQLLQSILPVLVEFFIGILGPALCGAGNAKAVRN